MEERSGGKKWRKLSLSIGQGDTERKYDLFHSKEGEKEGKMRRDVRNNVLGREEIGGGGGGFEGDGRKKVTEERREWREYHRL